MAMGIISLGLRTVPTDKFEYKTDMVLFVGHELHDRIKYLRENPLGEGNDTGK
jgi:hypothetical protein